MNRDNIGRFMKGSSGHNKGGRIFRSGYYYLKIYGHPNGGKQKYIAEHRLVMEKYLGRYLEKCEVVHHINGIITDNRIENLELFSSHGQHTKNGHPEIFEKQRIRFKGKHFSPRTEFKKGMTPWNKGFNISTSEAKKLREIQRDQQKN